MRSVQPPLGEKHTSQVGREKPAVLGVAHPTTPTAQETDSQRASRLADLVKWGIALIVYGKSDETDAGGKEAMNTKPMDRVELVKLLYEQDVRFYGDSCVPGRGRHDPRRLVCEVVADLPERVREWATNTIIFIGLTGQLGESLPIRLLKHDCEEDEEGFLQFRFVLLSEKVMRLKESEAKFTIAHEIAHVWLKQDETGNYVESEKAERQADAQAKKWGFAPPTWRLKKVKGRTKKA